MSDDPRPPDVFTLAPIHAEGRTIEERSAAAPMMPVMSVDDAAARVAAVREFKDRCMVAGTDYDTGETFGSAKPSLLQPGAQSLQWFFGLTVETAIVQATEDWDGSHHDGEGIFAYQAEARVYLGGILIAIGHGMASTRESAHRWRWVAESDLPAGMDPSLFKSRTTEITEFDFAIRRRETSGPYGKPKEYWDDWEAATNDGRARQTMKKTRTGEAEAWVMGGTVYRVPNENIADVANSVLKVAIKRAYVDGIIRATGTSSLFTQDGDDADANAAAASGSAAPTTAPAPKAAAPKAAAPKTAPPTVDPNTGEILEQSGSAAFPLSPLIWSLSGLAVTKTRQTWKTLGDCDTETLRAFFDIPSSGDLDRDEQIRTLRNHAAYILSTRETATA